MKLFRKLVFAKVPCSISMFLYQGGMVFYVVYHVEQYVEK